MVLKVNNASRPVSTVNYGMEQKSIHSTGPLYPPSSMRTIKLIWAESEFQITIDIPSNISAFQFVENINSSHLPQENSADVCSMMKSGFKCGEISSLINKEQERMAIILFSKIEEQHSLFQI